MIEFIYIIFSLFISIVLILCLIKISDDHLYINYVISEMDDKISYSTSEEDVISYSTSEEDIDTTVIDPLFVDDTDRFVLFPIKYHQIWELYKFAVSCFWTADEIDLEKDFNQFQSLTSDEKHYLTHVLAFFAASDGIVNENVIENMMSTIKIPEARCFYGFQIAIENIHAETYSLLIDTFVTDEEKRHELLNAINTIPSIQKKAEWCLRWIENEDATFEQRLVAFAIVEGVFFSSSFCALYWMKKRNLLPGLCFSNELISRDEYLHVEFACLLKRTLKHQNLPQDEFEEMIRDAVDCEIFFVQEGLPVTLIGMNCDLMCQYVWYIADRLAERLDYKPVFGQKTHQFDWMNLFRMDVKSNTHENQNSQYQKVVDVNRIFTTDEDF